MQQVGAPAFLIIHFPSAIRHPAAEPFQPSDVGYAGLGLSGLAPNSQNYFD
jgi:hypothetical protein